MKHKVKLTCKDVCTIIDCITAETSRIERDMEEDDMLIPIYGTYKHELKDLAYKILMVYVYGGKIKYNGKSKR